MNSKIYTITDFGAVPNGELMTAPIQQAIDTCFLNGGGKVIIPAGDFYVGGIRLRSNVTLYLQENAHLIGSRNPEDYMCFLTDKVEPILENDKSDIEWIPPKNRTCFDHLNKPGSRWNNALIRAIDAKNIAIIGEQGSYIDGRDCFDEQGEEYYRGPHGIDLHRCKNIRFEGYTAKNTGNWAHTLFECEYISVHRVKIEGGHDGVHARSCSEIEISECEFYTGDDCIAGFDNLNVKVTGCLLNTACSGLRFGGTNVLIENCKFFGPARYLFRGSLSKEEKRAGIAATTGEKHRYNMLSAFTYLADFTRTIRHTPGNIVMRNCIVENTDRFFHFNFSGNEVWQCNRPLRDVTFQNIRAIGIKLPITMYGSQKEPLEVTLEDVEISFDRDASVSSLIHAYGLEKLTLCNVKVENVACIPIVKTWDKGGAIVIEKFDCGKDEYKTRELATEEFSCKAI